MEEKYKQYNAIIVKECVNFYHQCWKDRCDLNSNNNNLKEVLLLEVERITENYDNTINPEICEYLRQKPSNMPVKTNEFIA